MAALNHRSPPSKKICRTRGTQAEQDVSERWIPISILYTMIAATRMTQGLCRIAAQPLLPHNSSMGYHAHFTPDNSLPACAVAFGTL
jgi:hypothetical protein